MAQQQFWSNPNPKIPTENQSPIGCEAKLISGIETNDKLTPYEIKLEYKEYRGISFKNVGSIVNGEKIKPKKIDTTDFILTICFSGVEKEKFWKFDEKYEFDNAIAGEGNPAQAHCILIGEEKIRQFCDIFQVSYADLYKKKEKIGELVPPREVCCVM